MLHKEIEQSHLRQLLQMAKYLIGYQMEATGSRSKCKFYLLYHRMIRAISLDILSGC